MWMWVPVRFHSSVSCWGCQQHRQVNKSLRTHEETNPPALKKTTSLQHRGRLLAQTGVQRAGERDCENALPSSSTPALCAPVHRPRVTRPAGSMNSLRQAHCEGRDQGRARECQAIAVQSSPPPDNPWLPAQSAIRAPSCWCPCVLFP